MSKANVVSLVMYFAMLMLATIFTCGGGKVMDSAATNPFGSGPYREQPAPPPPSPTVVDE